jgi:hypothetical protein
MSKPYKVHLGGKKYRRFDTLEDAAEFCNEHARTTKVILSVEAPKLISTQNEPFAACLDRCASRIFQRLYQLSTGHKFPDGEIVSPAANAIIIGELEQLVCTLMLARGK